MRNFFFQKRSLTLIAIFAAGLGFPLFGAVTPSIQLSSAFEKNSQFSVSECEAYAVVPDDRLDRLVNPKMALQAIGRTQYRLSLAELANLKKTEVARTGFSAKTKRGGYFDLWGIASQFADKQPNFAICLRIEIEAKKSGDCLLGLGCCDSAVVWTNGIALFAVAGPRDFCTSENIVALPLVDGVNRIEVVLQKAHPWSVIPGDHFKDEWAADLALYQNSEAAVLGIQRRNFHLLDTPVLSTPEDVVCNCYFSGDEPARLFDTQGTEIARGPISENGRVQWTYLSPAALASPSGFFVWKNVAEPLLLKGSASVDTVCSKLLDRSDMNRDSPWAIRVAHLIEPQYTQSPDRWWSRKVALSSVKLLSAKTPVGAIWNGSRQSLKEYKSKIDGSSQYYQFYEAARPGRTAVILPGVPLPLRNFLDGYVLADLKESEILMSEADDFGLGILWPGTIDVDYGGVLCRTEIGECLDAFTRSSQGLESSPIFLVGTCSAGTAALRCWKDLPNISGVVLWSPVVKRTTHRWFPNVPLQTNEFPLSVLSSEAVNVVRLPSHVPCYILFDIDVPGHGDRPSTEYFADTLAQKGYSIESNMFSDPDPVMVWGQRAAASERIWMAWIDKQHSPSKIPVTASAVLTSNYPTSVKEALLEGFCAAAPTSKAAVYWLNWWRGNLRLYRGAAFSIPSTGGQTKLSFQSQSFSSVAAQFSDGVPQLSASPEADSAHNYTRFWGFRLRAGDGANVVEVWNSADDAEAPLVDLFLDGCCKGALWGQSGKEWHLIQVWL